MNVPRGILFSLDCRWVSIGLLLLLLHVVLLWISPAFAAERPLSGKPAPVLVIVGFTAGAIYLFLIRLIPRTEPSRMLLVFALLAGGLMRISQLPSVPMLEDDYYRYLWDGAVLANGFNPYAFPPSEISIGFGSGGTPAGLRQLAEQSGDIIQRVNHPYLHTIYPPVSQLTFAIAHWLKPWSLVAWRIILFTFDLGTLLLLIVTLRTLNLCPLWSVAYWWNPLVIKEVYNSAHMDVIVLPFLLGSLLLAVRRRLFSASCLLAFATGAKIWPVIILPLVLQPKFTSHKVLVAALGIFAVLTAVIFFPLVINSVQDDSGFLAYAEYWEMNDTLFMIFLWASDYFLQTLTEEDGDAQLAARVLVVVLLGIWLVLLVIRQSRVPADLYEKSVWAVAALFLLSPTQFPWYYIWLLPLLAIRPHFSLYLLTPLLFVYYLRFYFQARGNVNLFDYGIVWLEFVPVWLFLVREKFFVGKPISAKAPGGSCIYEK